MSLTLPKRNFTRNKWRTFLIILGIAISVGIETGIAVSVDSLYNDFIENHRGNNFTDITIHSNRNSTLEEMRELEQTVKNIDGVMISSLIATFTLIDLPSFV
ncbi:MAG: ABC transporter permease, partial [Candidatus Hodarchaeales archaeon]